jgi:hypothetical protein
MNIIKIGNIKTSSNNVFNRTIYSYDEFNMFCFIKFIMEHLYLNSTYTIMIKLGFFNSNSNSVFYMLGSQIGIKLKDSHDIDKYKNIYNIIMLGIDEVISRYVVESFSDTVEISYKFKYS